MNQLSSKFLQNINVRNRAFWLLVCLLFGLACFGNSAHNLHRLETSIHFLNSDSSATSSLQALLKYQEAVRLKSAVVTQIEEQLPELKEPLETTVDSVRLIDTELAVRKKMYAKTVVTRYRNYKLLNNVFFLLRSTSINELFKRMSYLKMIARYQEARVKALKQDVIERNKVFLRYERQADQWKHWQTFSERMRIEEKRDAGIYQNLVRSTKRQPYRVSQEIKEHNRQHWLFRKEIASYTDLKLSAKDAQETADSIPQWMWPVDTGVVLLPYGFYAIPNSNTPKIMSKGLCIKTDTATAVKAATNGLITHVINHPMFGTIVLMQSEDRMLVYGYLSGALVQTGDVVLAGQVLGSASASSHHIGNCFFGVIVNNRFVDPMHYLMPSNLNQEG